MKQEFDEKSIQLISSRFELEQDLEAATEEQLIIALSDRIAWMIEYSMEYLLSLLYRMDVLEVNINEALNPANPDPANVALAKLIVERQKLRIQTRKDFKSPDLEDEADWNL